MKTFIRQFVEVVAYSIRMLPGTQARENMPKFCANLSFMFPNVPFQDRYLAAQNCGFKAVESSFPPSECHVGQLRTIINDLDMHHVMMNSYAGDTTKGENGFAAIPGKEKEFKDSLLKTIEYAEALRIKKIHVLAGIVEVPTELNDITYENNLIMAEALLRQHEIVGLIEPINPYSLPGYYLNSYERALDLIKKINSPNLKLMLDIFHLQQIQGNVFRTLAYIMPYVGHVQIAQVPNRNEPNTKGELEYKFILDTITRSGYKDWIGLEYIPTTSVQEGISWLAEYDYYL